MLKIKKAVRRNIPVKLLLQGMPGSGKTMSALRVGRGLVGPEGCIVVLDSDSGGKSNLYANLVDADGQTLHFYHFNMVEVFRDFRPSNYMRVIRDLTTSGFEDEEGVTRKPDLIVIDSMSQAWNAEGGIMDQRDKMGGKGLNPWRKLTPQQREFVQCIVDAPVHIIATVRQKVRHVQDDQGVRKAGMGMEQRDDLEYEFDIVCEIDQETHRASVTKSRCDALADRSFDRPGKAMADILRTWSEGGDAPAQQVQRGSARPAEPERTTNNRPSDRRDDGELTPGVSLEDAQRIAKIKRWPDPAKGDPAKARQTNWPSLRDEILGDMIKRISVCLNLRTKGDMDDEAWATVKADNEWKTRTVLKALWGIQSRKELTLEHAAGEHGMDWLHRGLNTVISDFNQVADQAAAAAK